MFGVLKHIALKMALKSNCVLQKTFINFRNLNFRMDQQNIRKLTKKNTKNRNIFGSKASKDDPSTLNYVLPSSFTTLSTC